MVYVSAMRITPELFGAFLQCPTKCWLKSTGEHGTGNAYAEWAQVQNESHRGAGVDRLRSASIPGECATSPPAASVKEGTWRLALDVMAQTEKLESRLHGLERIPSEGRGKPSQFIPIRFVSRNKFTQNDKLLTAFDALVLSEVLRRDVDLAKIIHGDDHATLKVKTSGLVGQALNVTVKVTALLASQSPPELILNRHCPECEFRDRCRQKAVEKNDLSLLAGMTEKEHKQYHSKGIFTVTQLSYTFRPRRRPKRMREKREKYHHALKALAIREKKIHIVGSPELKIEGTPVYLDVEGLPDRELYYLIGVRIRNGEAPIQHSLWADTREDQMKIWNAFLSILTKVRTPILIHYGSYETIFLKRMSERYGKPADVSTARAISTSINLLSVTFAQVYFPVFSNGLKDIAGFLGCKWSNSQSSGLQSIVWRHQWEVTHGRVFKDALLTYNAEDCQALESFTRRLLDAGTPRTHEDPERNIVHADSLTPEKKTKWGDFATPVPAFGYINEAAHWDYQKHRIHVRSADPPPSRAPPRRPKSKKPTKPEKVVNWPEYSICPTCKQMVQGPGQRRSRILVDIVFGRDSVKRRVVRYVFHTHRCPHCQTCFGADERFRRCYWYGWNVTAYYIYHLVGLCIPQRTVVQMFNRLFGFVFNQTLNYLKIRAAEYYADTTKAILERIAHGSVVHVDETHASIKGTSAFVWVLTNGREVAYVLTNSREGATIQKLLAEFRGVLVADFYSAYDNIGQFRQRCLIHLVRELNDALLDNPFDEEFRRLVLSFGDLLKAMVETADGHGLKAHFLKKHLAGVGRFYKSLTKAQYQSEIARQYVKKFQKDRGELFTFLSHDGVAWHNNNAEHAIKAFVWLREVVGGVSSKKSLDEYLTLLSICQTCKYQGLDFLDFLRSGEKDIEVFAEKHQRCRNRPEGDIVGQGGGAKDDGTGQSISVELKC